MTLQELSIDQTVTVQVVWGTTTQDITTGVHKIAKDSILLKPIIYRGVELDLSTEKNDSISFNLYCADKDGNHVMWEDVHFDTVLLENHFYYRISIKKSHQLSTSAFERRKEMRMDLDLPGVIPTDGSTEPIQITIHDISQTGISILVPANVKPAGQEINIVFSDIVNSDIFLIPMHLKVVRSVPQARDLLGFGTGTVLYGCQILSANDSLLTYILVKRSSLRTH